jgi:hypothetical protein
VSAKEAAECVGHLNAVALVLMRDTNAANPLTVHFQESFPDSTLVSVGTKEVRQDEFIAEEVTP